MDRCRAVTAWVWIMLVLTVFLGDMPLVRANEAPPKYGPPYKVYDMLQDNWSFLPPMATFNAIEDVDAFEKMKAFVLSQVDESLLQLPGCKFVVNASLEKMPWDQFNDPHFFRAIPSVTWDESQPDQAAQACQQQYSSLPEERRGSHFYIKSSIVVPGGKSDESNQGCQDADGMAFGDPIHAGTGNVFEQEQDLAFNPWLTLRRAYNSQRLDSDRTLGDPLGSQWQLNLQSAVQRVSGKDDADEQVRVVRPCGSVLTFVHPAQGATWIPSTPGIQDVLTEQTDVNGQFTGWHYRRDDNHWIESYDAQGTLRQLEDPNGLSAILTYSDPSTDPAVAPVAGLLIGITDPYGRALQLRYDSDLRVRQVQAPDGTTIDYAYQNALLSQVTYPGNRIRRYHYDEPVQNPSDRRGLLTRVIDENGHDYATFTYDDQGRAISSSHAGGADKVSIRYNDKDAGSADGTSDITYATGLTTELSYATTRGRMQASSISTPCNPICERNYASQLYDDKTGLLQVSEDFAGHQTVYAYTPQNLLSGRTQIMDGGLNATTFTWDATLRQPLTRITTLGTSSTKTGWAYNPRGQTLAYCEIDYLHAGIYTCSDTGTAPAGVRRWTAAYCDAIDSQTCPLDGLLLTRTGPLGDATTYRYYTDTDESGCANVGGACHRTGDLYVTTNALGHTTTVLAYDKNGRVTRQRDSNGVITDLSYSSGGALLSRIVRAKADGSASAKDAITQLAYDPSGNLTQLVYADGVSTTYTYDDAQRLTDITDALGQRIHYTLDAVGHPIKEETLDASGHVRQSLTRSYNTLGQLRSVMDGLNRPVFDASASKSYDVSGNLVQSTDGLGVQRKHDYDGLGRLVKTIDDYQGTAPDTQNATTAYTRNALDQVTQLIDPDGHATQYTYDGLGNLTQQVSPDTRTTNQTVDAAGNVLTRTDARGITATFTYDALSRLTAIHYPDGVGDVSYTYDAADIACTISYPIGRLTRVTENAVNTVYCYDASGQVIEKRQTTAAGTDVTGYTYTAAGRLSGIVYPSGTWVSFARGSDGHVQSIDLTPVKGAAATVVSQIVYQPFGPVSSYTLGNGQAVARTFDANGQITGIASPAFNAQYDRNVFGNIVTTHGTAENLYTYDALARLTQMQDGEGGPLETYTYSKTGDRQSKTGSGFATGEYGYQKHWLMSVGTESRTYDAIGNTLTSQRGGNDYGYVYDNANRLSQVRVNGNVVADYLYTIDNERIAKTVGDHIDRYVYNEASQLLSESGDLQRDYLWLDDLPIAVVDGGTTVNYVIADALNTPRVITDGNGATVWQWNIENNAFGEQLPTGSFTHHLRFPGQYYDEESGLFYNVHRYYEPAAGRYIQSDPAGLLAGLNTYAYVGGNPISNFDPFGLRALSDCEKNALNAYIPQVDLNKANLHDGEVPGYLGKSYDGITRGNDIYFRPGVYDSKSSAGIALLGHELVHVGQYRNGMNWIIYIWSTRNGYGRSKYEKDAYATQAHIESDLQNVGFNGCGCQK
jgi:RHS repeat-associated protein